MTSVENEVNFPADGEQSWQWQRWLETICWNYLKLRAIYQMDCNEQQHYLRTVIH